MGGIGRNNCTVSSFDNQTLLQSKTIIVGTRETTVVP